MRVFLEIGAGDKEAMTSAAAAYARAQEFLDTVYEVMAPYLMITVMQLTSADLLHPIEGCRTIRRAAGDGV